MAILFTVTADRNESKMSIFSYSGQLQRASYWAIVDFCKNHTDSHVQCSDPEE